MDPDGSLIMRQFSLLLLCVLPVFAGAQTPRKQQIRAIVRDTACAPARGWIARETTFTTLTAARTFGQRNPLFCPVVPPPPPPPPPVDTTPVPPPPPVVVPPVVPPAVPSGAFLESFTGQPTTPQPFRSPLWHVLQFTTTAGGPVQLNPSPVLAQHHGETCAGPPNTHLVTTYERQVFLCRDHMMTAVSEEGNGGIVLTPARMLDFSAGEQVLSFDLNTASQSGRDWWIVWVTPWEDVLQAPVFPDDGVAAMNGTPRNAILIDAEADNPCAVLIVNYVRTRLPCSTFPALKDRFPVSFSVRDKIEIRISRTRVRVSMPVRGITFVDAALPQPLAWSQGVVQLGHYSYNPTKDNDPRVPNPGPNTWHWDEVFLSNAVPFSLIAADRRDLTNADGPVTVTFAAPAPAGAVLRMLARGARPEVSLDNGATWRVPPLAQYSFFDEPNEQYVMPVPQGLQSIRVRRGAGISWWPGNAGWFVRGFSLWAR
jgi:hypothetical protein